MNRYLLPLLILLGSLLYSWFWNCVRKPECEYCKAEANAAMAAPSATLPAATEQPKADTLQANLTPEEKLLFTPLDVYFEVNKSSIAKTAEIDTFLVTAKKYLAKKTDEKLLVTGHTDSDGSDELNQKLSLKRAEIAKQLLVKDGFNTSQIEVAGMGEKEPIAPNDTPENKAKNRRATIRLKN